MNLLRSIRPKDIDVIFKWRNNLEIISKGITQRGVTKEEHNIWFEESLVGKKRKIFIIEYNQTSIGQIRFDRLDTNSNECFVSIYLFSNKKNGLGTKSLKEGIDIICKKWRSLQLINAIVLKKNISSKKFFEKNGFSIEKEENEKIILNYKIK